MTEGASATSDKGSEPEVRWPSRCYRCGAALEPGSQRCPQCGRRQTRYCYCGNAIPVTFAKCPYCGADWSMSMRVRRKSRSRRWDWRMFAAYCGAGALAAVAAAAVVNSLVGALALRSLPPGHTGLPGAFSARLSLALATVGRTVATIWGRVISVGGAPWVGAAIAGSGLLAGALTYAYRTGKLRIRLRVGKRRVHKRRRQGVY